MFFRHFFHLIKSRYICKKLLFLSMIFFEIIFRRIRTGYLDWFVVQCGVIMQSTPSFFSNGVLKLTFYFWRNTVFTFFWCFLRVALLVSTASYDTAQKKKVKIPLLKFLSRVGYDRGSVFSAWYQFPCEFFFFNFFNFFVKFWILN